MECPSLLGMSRNTIRQGVRAQFLLGIEKFEREFVQRQTEHNRRFAVFDDTPPLYNYSQIFYDAIKPYIRRDIVQGSTLDDVLRGHMDVLEFVSPQHETGYIGLDSYRMGMPARVGTEGLAAQEGPVRYERFIQFIGWLQMAQPAVVPHIMQNVSRDFQYRMFSDNFSMELFRLALRWDIQYTGALLFNEHISQVHFMMSHPNLALATSFLFMDKLKEIVAVYGDQYLMHIPTSDFYATSPLVTMFLRGCKTTDFSARDHAVLDYLILACPAALRVRSRCARGHTAFSVLCERWNDPGIAQHVWMVDNVMRHADITDIRDVLPAHKMTLLQYAKKCRNVLVLDYIWKMFGI